MEGKVNREEFREVYFLNKIRVRILFIFKNKLKFSFKNRLTQKWILCPATN